MDCVLRSYAQNFEDVMLWRALGHIECGFYIDIGAQDPVVDSVSLGFYEKGWRGTHVEPTPGYAQALRDARPDEVVVQAAIGDENTLIPFFEIPGTGLSTGDAVIADGHEERGFAPKHTQVPCIRLAILLDNHRHRAIHWMKIDVEGMESSVIRSWLPSAVRPWILVVEATLPLSGTLSHTTWEDAVLELGYQFAYFDGLNRFYVAENHDELLAAFTSPPNIFDGFVLSGTSSTSFCASLNAAVIQSRQEADDLNARLAALESELVATPHDDGATGRVVELEKRLSEEAGLAAQRLHDALIQSRHVAQVLEQMGQAKDETLMLLRTLSAKDDVHSAQAAAASAAREELVGLKNSLAAREALIGDIRLRLVAAESGTALLQAELSAHHESTRIRLVEQENAFVVAIGNARIEQRELARQEFEEKSATRLAEQGFRYQFELASRLALQEAAFAAQLKVERAARHESTLLNTQQAMQAQLAEIERGFTTQLTRMESQVFELLASMAQTLEASSKAERAEQQQQQRRRWEQDSERADRVESMLLLAKREMQAQWLEQQQSVGLHLRLAEANLGELRSHLAAQQQVFNAEREALRSSSLGKLLGWMGWQPLSAQTAEALRSPVSVVFDVEPDISVASFSVEDVPAPAHQEHSEAPLLEKLLVLNDREFVRAAYMAVLGRGPDPVGETNYVDCLRLGIDKIVLLCDMARSEEGRRVGRVVPGLREALRQRRIRRLPLLGPLLLTALACFKRPADHDPARAYRAQTIGVQHTTLEQLADAHASIRELRQHQAQVDRDIQQIGAQQVEIQGSAMGRLLEVMAEVQVCLRELRQRQDHLENDLRQTSVSMRELSAEVKLQREQFTSGNPEDGPQIRSQLIRKASLWKA